MDTREKYEQNVNTGHANGQVMAAARQQMERLVHEELETVLVVMGEVLEG